MRTLPVGASWARVRLTSGVALYSDMGRVLASITEDSCGWHDTITGHTTASTVSERWGSLSYQ
jgi:uncharacterized protein YcgI (DUF1989 family)